MKTPHKTAIFLALLYVIYLVLFIFGWVLKGVYWHFCLISLINNWFIFYLLSGINLPNYMAAFFATPILLDLLGAITIKNTKAVLTT